MNAEVEKPDNDPPATDGPSCPIGGSGTDGDSHEPVQVSSGSNDGDQADGVDIPERLPVLPVRDTCAFPGTVVPLQIHREKSKRVLNLALTGSRLIAVVAQRSPQTEDPHLDDLYRVGTACIILKMLKMPDGTETIIVHGVRRVGIEAITKEDEYLEATVHPYSDPKETTTEQKALAHSVRTAAERIIELSPNIPEEARQVLNGIETPGGLADFLAANLSLTLVHRQELLETFDVTERLRKVNLAVATQLEVAEMSSKIQQRVREQVDKSQKEYYLREQLKAIRHELGDEETQSTRLDELRERVKAAKMPEVAAAEADRELERMRRIPQASPEYSMAMDYVEWLVELPWSVGTEDNLDAEQILDEDHYGLEKVKKRILEFLAVRSLKKDSRGPILCFAGPPGVGKTSLGQSIARALGRKFIRISLGGIRDEATIRGHRRTYIGAMPGRIIREIRRGKSNNPLFMLDEVDKIGQDVRGDPMSALLEVLDPAQNATFSDHYLAVPFDLSKVLFIATANYMSAVQPALRDRMEVIELTGYTDREKLMIAKKYLLPRQLNENGLSAEQLHIDDEAMSAIISEYTKEAGVRELERQIGSICRARAAAIVRGESPSTAVTDNELRTVLGPRKYESEVAASLSRPGVVTGLAFTPVGGEILFIEAAVMPGTGQLKLTGQLGDVMRESAIAASSIIRSRTAQWRIKTRDLQRVDIHVHVPAGATPKDGPSAGVAMLTAMTSILTDQAVNPTIGMTGEITLSGRVLPVGGIREKVLAAFRAGLSSVILPARNEQDLEEVAPDVREHLKFVFVRSIDELFATVFDRKLKKNRGPRRARKAPAGLGVKKKTMRRTALIRGVRPRGPKP
jgi:ATP-dependent Lon protease